MKNTKNMLVKFGVTLGAIAMVFSFASPASAALTLGALTITSDGALTMDGAAGSALTIGSTTTTGNIAIGGALTSGTLTLGGSMVYTPAVSPDRDVFELGADGNNATLRVFSENLTAFAIKGIDFTDGSTVVNSYSGIYGHADYSTIGITDTKFITGGNPGMDVQLQSADALLLIAQDGSSGNGVVKVMSQNGIEFHAQYDAEQLSPKRLIVSRVSTAATGVANTSDVTLGTNSGKLYLQQGTVLGGVVFPNMTSGERDALTGTAGEVIYNTTTSKLQVFTTTWVDLH